ncbi:MAG: phosphatidylserine/phosphatidylglycerophosphate/cardiolipin synthase family protein [Firmicutes bacterium]|nr:phosphatidylserine/phosphatidylglycerophosphate/cardiolipin synthase family protein [Bacillota bacterium]
MRHRWKAARRAVLAALAALVWLTGGCGAPAVPGASGATPDGAAAPPAPGGVSEAAAPGAPLLLDGPAARAWALRAIEGARQSVDLEMYELGDRDLIAALVDAHRRGVAVRVILDATESHSREALPLLEAARVPVRAVQLQGGIDHVKLLVVDGRAALVGGINWGPRSWENHDWDVAFAEAPEALARHVAADWRSGRVRRGAEDGPLVYADGRIQEAMLADIASARRTVDIEADALSDRDIVDALAAAARRGVRVTVVASPQERTTRSAVVRLRRAGVDARYARGLILHAKVLVVDETIAWLGSANFSAHADLANHELDVRLVAPALARRLAGDARRLWAEGGD